MTAPAFRKFTDRLQDVTATRAVVSTFGALAGFFGMEHGFFEVLQGNVAPGGLFFEAVAPHQSLWPDGNELAMTLVPNLFVTGLLAMITGFLVICWSIAFVQRKLGASILLILSIILLLVGGGIAPVELAVVAAAVATRINKPLNWWRDHLSSSTRGILAKTWPWSLIMLVGVSLFTVSMSITGWPLLFMDLNTALSSVWILAFVMLGLIPLAVLSGFTRDIENAAGFSV
ncbi:MAG: hypothetical protein ACFFD4_18295 [Candidatus Odinarchaeota archaeon]